MKSIITIGVLSLILAGCSAPRIECKSWHDSPCDFVRTSTMYESVDWSVIEKLHIDMLRAEVDQLFHILSVNNSGDGFVYSTLKGKQYEIAMRFSKDRQKIQDISYKEIELSETAKKTILSDIKVSTEPGITREEARKITEEQ